MKPLIVTSGEPAGIGIDLCLALRGYHLPVVVLADSRALANRAHELGLDLIIEDYKPGIPVVNSPNQLTVLSIPCREIPVAGKLNIANASYVLQMLTIAVDKTLAKEFSAIVTAPVHKGVINQAGIEFTGHTEFFASRCNAQGVVMMLASKILRVALATTHIPLEKVSDSLTTDKLRDVILTLNAGLKEYFGILNPRIFVAGLNPHAGENGFLGLQEIEIIIPVLNELKLLGINVFGPFSADTMFLEKNCDAFLAMYHDQGLPVLKYSSFGCSVNITLGLPIIRTSVDHGTALQIAGLGKAKPDSLLAAVEMAYLMAKNREQRR